MTHSKAQIVATLGSVSDSPEKLKAMIEHQLDVVRLNFSWADCETRTQTDSAHSAAGKRMRAAYTHHRRSAGSARPGRRGAYLRP